MLCKSCGKQIEDGASTCVHCGASLQAYAGSPDNNQDLRIGTTLEGKYRLDEKIGSGGMATVYRAARLMIGDFVAVKILHEDQLTDSQATERFRREAQAAAKLRHTNSVTIHDFGVAEDGTTYLVMELVQGDSLRHWIEREGALSPLVAADVLTQSCAALDAAHAQGIVHRDVKPSNIMVMRSPEGIHVKVLDFGIARIHEATPDANLTQVGHVLGTPQFMSPEQCLGEELDVRSDVYSLGVVLYEMLSGEVPFDATSSMAVVAQQITATPPSLRVANPNISPAVEAVVNSALQKRRDDRPQSAGALASQFNQALSAVSAPPNLGPQAPSNARFDSNQMQTVAMSAPPSPSASPPGTFGSPVAARPVGTAKRAPSRSKNRIQLLVAAILIGAITAGVNWWQSNPDFSLSDISSLWSSSDTEEGEPDELSADSPASESTDSGDGNDGELADELADPSSSQPTNPLEPSQSDRAVASADAPAAQPAAPPRSRQSSAPVTPRGRSAAPRQPTRATSRTPPPSASNTGSLTIRALPASVVHLDGKDVGRTNSGGFLALNDVPVGRHLVVVQKDGYADAETTIAVIAGRSELVQLKSTELPGLLTVTANIDDVTLRIEGIGEHRLPLARLKIPAGVHPVVASKAGYTPVQQNVNIRAGEATTLSLVLEPVPIEVALKDAQTKFDTGRYSDAARSALAAVNQYPDAGEAYLLLGHALYHIRRFNESTDSLGRAIELGHEVELSAKHRHAGLGFREGFCAGSIILSKTNVTFRSIDDPDHGFSVAPNKILGVKVSREQVDTRISVVQGNKERKRNVDFIHNDTVRGASEDAAVFTELTCNRCDASLTVLGALLQKVRGL